MIPWLLRLFYGLLPEIKVNLHYVEPDYVIDEVPMWEIHLTYSEPFKSRRSTITNSLPQDKIGKRLLSEYGLNFVVYEV